MRRQSHRKHSKFCRITKTKHLFTTLLKFLNAKCISLHDPARGNTSYLQHDLKQTGIEIAQTRLDFTCSLFLSGNKREILFIRVDVHKNAFCIKSDSKGFSAKTAKSEFQKSQMNGFYEDWIKSLLKDANFTKKKALYTASSFFLLLLQLSHWVLSFSVWVFVKFYTRKANQKILEMQTVSKRDEKLYCKERKG